MKAVMLFLAVSLLQAQDVLTLSGPSKVRANTTQTLTLAYTNPVPDAAGIQWTLGVPGGYAAVPAAGPAGTAAGKELACAAALCLLVALPNALNLNLIASGTVATYKLSIPLGTAGQTIRLPLSGLLGASPAGLSVPIVSGPVYSFTIYRKASLAVGLFRFLRNNR